uniref:Putative nuclease n=1 Tax=viral metagenome TaxID=1070528 RepID=A0A6H1Z9A2_9ZZZZ
MRIKLPNESKIGTIPKFEFSFPNGFILIIDTRENDNLFKRPPKGLTVVRDTLDAGDYSVRGFERSIVVERKSLPDFLGSIGHDRERFKKELDKLRDYERKWVFLEAAHEECLSYNQYSQMHPNAVRQTIASIEIRYGVPFYFQASRHSMERYLLDLFTKFYRVKRGE